MKKQVKLTLPEEVIVELTAEAEKTGLTVATYVRQLVYKSLQKKDENLVYHRRDERKIKATWKKIANLL